LTFLLGFGESQRIAAQEHLKEAHDAKAEKFTTCIEEVSAELDKASPQDKTLRDLAGVVVGELLRDLESAAAADLQSYEALHQLRILGKKLRYAMELFESCFASEFRERFYPAIVEMQDILGLANDSYTAAERLKSIRARLVDSHLKGWPKLEPGIEALIAFHEKRLPQQRKKFEKWWRAWMKSGAEQAFAELIRTKSE
jgi:CHAD domain-containing protein